MRQLLAFVLVTMMAVAVVGCDDDPATPKVTPSPYESQTRPWHVLHNLELAYDSKNIDRYAELFDADNFVFYFDPGDVGVYIPPDGQWGYDEEIQSARNMFSGDGGVEDNPILTIELTLFEFETAQWVEINDHPDFPGETLRQTTVVYDYFIDTVQDRQFITSGAPTIEVTVRAVDGKWKLVRWSDQHGGYLQRNAGESTDWGVIKALYQ